MYLNILLYTSYTFSALFLLLLFRTFSKTPLKEIWQMATDKVKNLLQLKTEIQKAEAKGEKPFVIPNTGLTIYSKSQAGAILKYKQMQRQEKASKRLKKTTKAS